MTASRQQIIGKLHDAKAIIHRSDVVQITLPKTMIDIIIAALQAAEAAERQEPRVDADLQAIYIPIPQLLHPDTAELVKKFAWRLAIKLRKAEQKYGYSNGWMQTGWMDECREKLVEHVAKGDPLDVAAYCAFLFWHGESTTKPSGAADEKAG